ncbi:MAG TPA: hypothetical protein DCE41_17475, partial [Cytophagales bacterium]|nr:hypothetical protein [Cytophagales bacterium]
GQWPLGSQNGLGEETQAGKWLLLASPAYIVGQFHGGKVTERFLKGGIPEDMQSLITFGTFGCRPCQ